jgi:hypothetical protein
MIAIVRSLVCTLVVACATSLALVAPVHATDFNDIWWNPGESGWGLNIAHQGNTVFLTFYIFGSDGRPTWITALLTRQGTSSTPPVTFTGQTVVSTGTYYGSQWNAANVTARVAGTASLTFNSVTTGTLTYSIDGVQVTRQIERYAFNLWNLAGSYIGSFIQANVGCTNPLNNGPQAGSGTFGIVHTPGQQVTITTQLNDGVRGYTCTYQATYAQAGRLGLLNNGTYTCTTGDAGTFNAYEIELASQGGILGRYDGRSTTFGCQSTGGFGGLKP